MKVKMKAQDKDNNNSNNSRKKRRLQITAVLLIAAVTLLFSSFGNQVAIEQRVLVHAMGIDFDGSEYTVSLQVFKTQSMGSDTPLDVSQSNIQTVTCQGKTVKEAIDDCQYQLGKEVFLGHLQLICFGKTVDFSSPEELFSFAIKDKNVFLGVELCLSDTTAEELMNVQLTRGTMSSENFTQVIKMAVRNGITLECRLIDFLSCINSPQYVPMPVIAVKNSEAGSSDNSEAEQQEPLLEISETALVKNGKVQNDTLTREEAAGSAWLMGKAKQFDMVTNIDGKDVDIKLSDDGKKITLDNENGRLIYKVKLTVLAHASKDIRSERQSDEISNAVKTQLTENITAAWNKTMIANEADIFGIWKQLRHKYPQGYLEYKDKLEELLRSTDLELAINCRVE